jgi:hypothetical protein
MSRQGSTGQIRVYYVATLASLTAPSAATIIAGTDLTPLLRRDGLTTPRSGNVLDASDASTRTNKSAPGNIDLGQISLRFQRDSVTGTDVAWTLLAEDVAGYIVVRRFGGSTVAIATSDKLEVYKGTVISREMQQIGDEVQNFLVQFSVEDSTTSAVAVA